LLDHVGRVEFAAQLPVDVQLSQQHQVLPKGFQYFRRVSGHERSSIPLFPKRRRLPIDEPRYVSSFVHFAIFPAMSGDNCRNRFA
jgi:hypothetical protein